MEPLCDEHRSGELERPDLTGGCAACRIAYLEAQESLLEEWQQRAKSAEEAAAEILSTLSRVTVSFSRANERLRALSWAFVRFFELHAAEVCKLSGWDDLSLAFHANASREAENTIPSATVAPSESETKMLRKIKWAWVELTAGRITKQQQMYFVNIAMIDHFMQDAPASTGTKLP